MLNEINTVDVGNPVQYLSASDQWQQKELNQHSEEENNLFVQPNLLEFVVTSHINLTRDITNDSVPTFVEAPSRLELSYRNPEAVKTYLARHREIEDFIEIARPILNKFFGSPVEVILELIVYPNEKASEELVGWIQKTGDVDDCLAQFEQFEDEWFLDHMDKVGDKFNFNIEIK